MRGTDRAVHLGGCLLALVAGWSAVSMLLKSRSGFPEVPELSEKRARWQERCDEFDVVFIGSSRTFHHIEPGSFADAVEAEGLPRPRAYNAGANLMFPPESFRWVRELLAVRPARLKWVVLEFVGIRGKGEFGEGYETSARGVWWHDVRHTRMIVDHLWRDQRLPLLEKMEDSLDHIRHAATVLSGAGREGEGVSHLFLTPASEPAATFDSETGFSGYDIVMMDAEDLAGYRRQLSDRLAGPPPPLRPLPASLRLALKDLVREIRAAGAELILIEPPAGIPLSRPMEPPKGVPHLCYNAVEASQAWYQPEDRRDGGHLLRAGARKFSAQLGRDFAVLVKKRAAGAK